MGIIFSLISVILILTPYPTNLVVMGESGLSRSNIFGDGTVDRPYQIDAGSLDLIFLENIDGYIEINCGGNDPEIILNDIEKVRIKDLVSTDSSRFSIENCGSVIIDNAGLLGGISLCQFNLYQFFTPHFIWRHCFGFQQYLPQQYTLDGTSKDHENIRK